MKCKHGHQSHLLLNEIFQIEIKQLSSTADIFIIVNNYRICIVWLILNVEPKLYARLELFGINAIRKHHKAVLYNENSFVRSFVCLFRKNRVPLPLKVANDLHLMRYGDVNGRFNWVVNFRR